MLCVSQLACNSESCPQYLLSVRPLLDDENYARVERLARDFEQTIAVKLQRYLVLKSWCVSLAPPPDMHMCSGRS